MANSVTAETIREFAADMIERYDRMKDEGKSLNEIFKFATGFFNGLIDGSIAILKNEEQTAAIRGYACIIADLFKRLCFLGKSPEEILISVRYYMVGTVDGIDISAGNPVRGNRH